MKHIEKIIKQDEATTNKVDVKWLQPARVGNGKSLTRGSSKLHVMANEVVLVKPEIMKLWG